jgi:hypothetical protein
MITELVVASTGASTANNRAAETEFMIAQIGQLTAEPAWESTLEEAALKLRTRPGLLVDALGRRNAAGEITVPLYLGPSSVSEREQTWGETALAIFSGSRYMPKNEREEIESRRFAVAKLLVHPLKRLDSR